MRIVIGLAVLVASLVAGMQPGGAQRAKPRYHPFCLEGGFLMRDCSYWTLAQCRAAARRGGHCVDNPAIAWEALRQGKPLPPPSKEWNY
jgi:Protein of unknown function (DUF3551)